MKTKPVNTVLETLKKWDFFDGFITQHGFTDYQRDYRLAADIIQAGNSLRPVEYLFRGCVEARYECRIINGFSLDNTLIDFQQWEQTGTPEGYVWGVNTSEAYPGWTYVEDSPNAARWSEALNLPFHEIVIETNVYQLALVFYDVTVKPLDMKENDS